LARRSLITAVPGAGGHEDGHVDRLVDEIDRAVGHGEIRAAAVVAPPIQIVPVVLGGGRHALLRLHGHR